MSDPINSRALTDIEGRLFARYLASPRDPALVGQEEMILAQDVVAAAPPK